MSVHEPVTPVSSQPIVRAMRARSPHDPHRAATPLELFFDLVFVVAIAQASSGLHHAIADAHALEGIGGYLMVFFAIWWAWMNFTWFASAYDLVLLTPFTGYGALLTGMIVAALLAIKLVVQSAPPRLH
jgi:low temperature requirement protein LtrA